MVESFIVGMIKKNLILIIFVNNLVSMILLINTIENLGVMIAAKQ